GGRVMKNVTGYDLVKLMAGSWGTLGVLTEVALKVLPAVEAEETLVIEGLAPEQAVAVMSAAMSTPYDVSGAAHLGGDAPRTCVRLEGFGDSVAYRAKQLSAELGRFGAVSLAGAGSAALWQQIRDLAPFHGAEGDVWKISVKPSDGPAVVARLGGAPVVMDWAGGLVWALMPQGTNLRPLLGGIAGHATLVRGGPDTHARLGTFHPEAPGVAALSTGLRRRFDPRGLFNPGLMSAGKEA
ncbi:MAG: glycolate oxidase subunit GlcE, partial [Marinibacterium sp.]|nr:glycolate oxidase subunit GlcE [Marinibacterium sp.]